MTHSGTRIRERRMARGLSQGDLAQELGISASYLNLIEHGRRRVGAKLRADLARVLRVEASFFDAGGDQPLVAALTAAAQSAGLQLSDQAQANDLARLFPAWAALLVTQAAAEGDQAQAWRLTAQERVSLVASAAQALVETDDLPEDWREVFARRIFDESRALHQLVTRLHPAGLSEADPQAAADGWLEGQGYHLPALEAGTDPAELANQSGLSAQAQVMVLEHLQRYRALAKALPLQEFIAAGELSHWRAAPLAMQFNLPLDQILRRMATLPDSVLPCAYVEVDAAGQRYHTRPLPGLNAYNCLHFPLHAEMLSLGRPVEGCLEAPDGGLYSYIALRETVDPADPHAPRNRMIFLTKAPDGRDAGLRICGDARCNGKNCRPVLR